METSTVQVASEPEANLYSFDAETIEIHFIGLPGKMVFHRLRRPTLDELIQRDQGSTFEMVEVSKREDQLISDEDAANAKLWEKIVLAVKGYKGFADWRELADTEKAQMRPGHKATAVKAMYTAHYKTETSDDEIGLGGDVWVVKQMIGPDPDKPAFTIYHHLREPAESEYRKFKRSASNTSQTRGSRKAHLRVSSNLKTYVELYDTLVEEIQGGTVDGQTFTSQNRMRFLASVDPVWKRQVIQTLMSTLEADLTD